MTPLSLFPSWRTRPSLKALLSAFADTPEALRFVGGCVRDSLLGLPVKDIDLATPLLPEILIQKAEKAGFKTNLVGLSHGTVQVIVDKHPYEITTLRSDLITDGRHAQVAYTQDWYEDASRRDFTCNALYLTLTGEVYDPFKGLEDLQRGCLRFIGNPEKRLAEDYLRTLRFFRFYARFGRQPPSQQTLDALRNSCAHLKKLSKERVTQELKGLLTLPNPERALHLMQDTFVLPTLLGSSLRFDLVQKVLELEKKHHLAPCWWQRLASLLLGDTSQAYLERLALSRKERHQIQQVQSLSQTSQDLAELFTSYGPDTAQHTLVLRQALGRESSLEKALKTLTACQYKAFPLGGQDALALGLRGAVVGTLLNQVKGWWVTHQGQPSRAACLQRLQTLQKSL